MIQPPEERLGPMTPQLAMRVAIVGSFALMMFAIIFFRLWFLQVLTGNQYAKAAEVNYVRHVAIAAPRGEILDSSGATMVDSVPVRAVQVLPDNLPVPVTYYSPTDTNILHQPSADLALYDRLARVLGMSTKRIKCDVVGYKVAARLAPIPCSVAQQVALVPFADVTVDTNVPPYIYAYLAERQNLFRGVEVEKAYLQQYPLGTQAAQVLGTVGPINAGELADKHRYRGVSRQAIVGQSGLEWEYDQYLRGEDGYQTVKVNSDGQFEGSEPGKAPIAGNNLATSLDLQLQETGQAALEHSIAANPPASGGAFVAMNPKSGEIYAMGSAPTFNPSIFTQPFVPQAEYNQLTNPSSGYPLLNRAIQSAGPTGSTFKPITATAALESGVWNANDIFDDTGQYCVSGLCLHNAGHAVDGSLNLVNAIRVSSDDFFYHLGALTNVSNPVAQPNGGALQQWAKSFGIGRKTGIDLPGEVAGTRPTPAWRAGRNRLEQECDDATGQFKGLPKHAPGGCGIADLDPWTIGDNVNMAVGQGDVQVTPLQLAVAYSALANGGWIEHPHIGLDIQSPNGTVLQKLPTPAAHNIHINPAYLATIQQGLRAAASQPGGTSDDVMGNFPEQVYGKTGTAQYIKNGVEQDYSWYACFVPSSFTSKPIVVVVWVEQGGFGDVAAAPVARQILSQWFLGKPGPFVSGSSQTL